MFNEKGAFFKCINEFYEGKTTIEDIINFENRYKIKISEDYKEFLLRYNGLVSHCGYKINDKYYALYNTTLDKINRDDFEYFDSLEFLIKGIEDYINDEDIDCKREIIEKKIIPFASNGAATSDLGIGVGEDNLGKIYTWSLDWDYEVSYVCNSFKELIEGYYLIEIDDEGEIIGSEKIFIIDED